MPDKIAAGKSAHGARLFPAGVHAAAQAMHVHTTRTVDLYFDLDLFLRQFDRSCLNVAFATLFRGVASRMSASVVAYIASAVMARQFLNHRR